MAVGLRSFEFKRVYEASTSDLPNDFYIPAMMRATSYDRAVGYFRSSVFHLMQIAVSDFVLRGGKMRLVCSTSLEPDDERVIRDHQVTEDEVNGAITRDIETMLTDPSSVPVIELLATLIDIGALDIKVVYKSDERGIFHTKVGIFRDDQGEAVSFDGSVNETFMAWAHNEERFKIFRSWLPGGSDQVADDQAYFDDLWADRRPSLTVLPLAEVARETLALHANPDPQAAVEKVRALARSSRSKKMGRPPKTLQEHQSAVLRSWWVSRSGIVDHVTGGGKTVTALACIREWFASVPRSAVLVVVPSDLLSLQWRSEIDSELAELDARILHAGGSRSEPKWAEYLRDFLREATSTRPRIVIATMDTAASDQFRKLAPVGESTLIVVDEVHKVGATARRRVLELAAGGRLGLSATPDRFGDPDGTAAIYDYFSDVLSPTFAIADAQAASPPRLVPYTYRVGVVSLDPDEEESYRKLTKKIGMLATQARSGDSPGAPERLRLAILERARVLKTASAKIEHAVATLVEHYASGDRWLVYCDDMAQLGELQAGLEKEHIPVTHYVSAMAFSKPDTLDRFDEIGGVLLSIRCLDEGIDIPAVSHALILASSINPREHLQRRGRVLRSAPGKFQAEIHDTLVGVRDSDGIRVFDHEVERARAFARDARNARHVLWRLDGLHRESDEWTDVENEEAD